MIAHVDHAGSAFASGTGVTVPKPAGLQAGHYVEVMLIHRGGANVTDLACVSGNLTQIGTPRSSGTTLQVSVWRKVAEASDVPGSVGEVAWTWNWAGANPGSYLTRCLSSTLGFPPDPVGAAPAWLVNPSDTQIFYPGFTPLNGGRSIPLIAGATAGGSAQPTTWTFPDGYTFRATVTNGTGTGTWRKGQIGDGGAITSNAPIGQLSNVISAASVSVGVHYELYETSGDTPPAPPTGLTATVHTS